MPPAALTGWLMKPVIFTGKERGLLPWCLLKAYMIWLQIAWILLKLACALPTGTRLQLVVKLHWLLEYPSKISITHTEKFKQGDTLMHQYVHTRRKKWTYLQHTHTHTYTHIWFLLTCSAAQKTAFRFNEPQLLSNSSALASVGQKNLKWECFPSLFQIYHVKIVIRPPTCAQTYNPQLHCGFLPKK